MRTAALLLMVALSIAACSGGDGGESDAPIDSATESPAASTAAGGQTQTDGSGNAITVHGWAPWPNQMALFDPYDGAAREEALYGSVQHAGAVGAGLWAADVEVCAASEGPGGFWEYVSSDGDATLANVEPQVLSPVFRWPAVGACSRGWLGLEAPDGAAPAGLRFVAGLNDSLDWVLGEPLVPAAASADWVIPLGDTVPLPEPMAGWTVAVSGWTEVGDTGNLGTGSGGSYVQPIEGSRLVAVLIEWCYELESDGGRPVPTFGVQIDGWNVMGDFQRGSPWGPGFEELQLAPPQGCASGWQAFEVPLGSEPSGVFVSDNNNTDGVWREWHFDEAARLDPPEGGGLGGAVAEALAACGVTEPLQVVSAGAGVDGTIASAVAIPTGQSRLDIYLSSSEISEADIPRPVDPAVNLLALGLEQTDGSSIAPGVFTDQVTGTQYGTVSAVAGGVEAGIRIFLGATVDLTEVTPTHVCGSISATSGSDSVSGRFGAPVSPAGG